MGTNDGTGVSDAADDVDDDKGELAPNPMKPVRAPDADKSWALLAELEG